MQCNTINQMDYIGHSCVRLRVYLCERLGLEASTHECLLQEISHKILEAKSASSGGEKQIKITFFSHFEQELIYPMSANARPEIVFNR